MKLAHGLFRVPSRGFASLGLILVLIAVLASLGVWYATSTHSPQSPNTSVSATSWIPITDPQAEKSHFHLVNGIIYDVEKPCDAAGCVSTSTVPADVKSFEVWSDFDFSLARDKAHIYWGNVPQSPQTQIIADADPRTFTNINNSTNNWTLYWKDKAHVWYSYFDGLGLVKDADPATFRVVYGPSDDCPNGCVFDAQDKNHKYLKGGIIQ